MCADGVTRHSDMSEPLLISYCTPVLNEELFLPFYLRNLALTEAPCELVVTDGGSTDNTVGLIEQFASEHPHIRVDLEVIKQTGRPYTDDWDEGVARNHLLDRCRGELVVLADADEIIEAKDLTVVFATMAITGYSLAHLFFVPFWGSLRKVRVNTPEDARWFGIQLGRIIRNGHWRYSDKSHHCVITQTGLGSTGSFDVRAYHLHYGFGKAGIKPGDNRRADLLRPEDNISMFAVPDIIEDPDFSDKKWKTDVGWVMHVQTEEYRGPWPEVLKDNL